MNGNESFSVIGAGAWGATLADLLARNGHDVSLWDRSSDVLDKLRAERQPFGVPELRLHDSVSIEEDLEAALRERDFVTLVIPSQAIAAFAEEISGLLNQQTVVLASKGIDTQSGRMLTDVLESVLQGLESGAVSGPCIAREVAAGVPTSVVCAARKREVAIRLRDAFATPRFRTYTQTDLIGVELGGALKNVIAIAAGISDGLGFGANTKSALLSRGLAEMTRLAVALGAKASTLYGLAGLGDLSVTCFSPHSRNRTFGELLGEGAHPDEARRQIGMTVEGEPTAGAALGLAEKHNVAMPITEAVANVCTLRMTPSEAVESLMRREYKDEFESHPHAS